jgi:ABC-type multidrug transport system permease subunit
MLSFKRLRAMFVARNREFFRDKAAFGWNFLFPFLLIAGFAIIFGGKERGEVKFAIVPCSGGTDRIVQECLPELIRGLRYAEYVGFDELQTGLDRLRHHKVDLLVDVHSTPYRYWMTDSSPRSYIAEQMILATIPKGQEALLQRQEIIAGSQIRYIDWLFPGILGMNMMFSALYGVGFVVVHYRKNGVLKRLHATPLTAFEYLSAQLLSRLFLLIFSLIILWIGCYFIFNFKMMGSYIDLAVMFLLGCLSLIALGLVVASRGTSEEFSNGLLNFITWPMMFLSEVWFSIEGAPRWVKYVAQLFPLTHLLSGVRKIMNDGAALIDVGYELTVLAAMTVVFLSIGAALFSWHK